METNGQIAVSNTTCRKASDLLALGIGQFGHGVLFARERSVVFATRKEVPALGYRIAVIVNDSALEQVSGVATRRVVASVTRQQVGNINTRQLQGPPGCANALSVLVGPSVALGIYAALPRPTFAGFANIDLAPKLVSCHTDKIPKRTPGS